MITEENYQNVWFLKFVGSFSVRKNSRSVLQSLEYAGALLNDPNNLVLIFPQGQLYSNHSDSILFEKGLTKLISFSEKKFQYIFAAMFADFFQHRKPSVKCYLATWQAAEFAGLQVIKSEFNKHYELSRREQARITA